MAHVINKGNVQMTPSGKPAVIDVLPGRRRSHMERANRMQGEMMRGALPASFPAREIINTPSGRLTFPTEPKVSPETQRTRNIRKEVFSPTKSISSPKAMGFGERMKMVGGILRGALRRGF
jgi:hypothetical protein